MELNLGTDESAARFYAWHAGIPVALAALLLLVFEPTMLDVHVQNFFYDPATRTFPLEDNWFLETGLHDAGKLPVILTGVGFLAAFVASFWRLDLEPWRRRLLMGALCIALAPLAVAGLKASSAIHCPRQLEIYGGRQPYIRLFDAVPEGTKRGHCWPGGHSSGGFALMGLYFVFRGRRPRLSRWCLAGGIAYGLGLGFGRGIQGAHFMSHTLWAGLVCWAVALALNELLVRRHESGDLRANST